MKNLELGNTDILESGGISLSRRSKAGVILAICFGFAFGSFYGVNMDKTQNKEIEELDVPVFSTDDLGAVFARDEISIDADESIVPYSQKNPINVSLEEINSMNIIINDNDCSESFINAVCQELDRDGISYSYTKNCENVDVEGAVVITLDQQYSAGPGTLIFAPLENGRLGNSDALALAAERAFYEKGFLVDGVSCGQMGFRENENGSVSERVPTPTEEAISDDKESSFVTISFGTQNTHAGLTAAGIEAMLTRYYSYIRSGYDSDDLIYCAENGDSYDEIVDKFGTTIMELVNYNSNVDKNKLLSGVAIVNPAVSEKPEFDSHTPTNLYIDKTLWSK